MPRDSNGVYTLPASNPVVLDTPIEPAWANGTLGDIADQLNNVITRDGLLGPTAPFVLVPGTAAAPGLVFVNDTDSGFYQLAVSEIGVSIAGTLRQKWTPSNGSTIYGNLNVIGNITASNAPSQVTVYPLNYSWVISVGTNGVSGQAVLNNAAISSVTSMKVDRIVVPWSSSRTGDLVSVCPVADTSKMYLFRTTGSVSLSGTIYTIPVTYIGNPTADATPTGPGYLSLIPQAST